MPLFPVRFLSEAHGGEIKYETLSLRQPELSFIRLLNPLMELTQLEARRWEKIIFSERCEAFLLFAVLFPFPAAMESLESEEKWL